MRWLLLLLLTVGLAGAAPPTLFGQAGMPDPWEMGTISPDSIYVRGMHVAVHLLMDSAFISVDSVDTQHLVADVSITGLDLTMSNNVTGNDVEAVDSLKAVTADLSGVLTGVTGTFSGDLQSEDFTATDSTTGVTADYTGLVTASDFTATNNVTGGDVEATDSLKAVTADLTGSLTGTTGTFTGDLQSEDFTATDSTTGVTADYSGHVDAGSVHVGSAVSSDSAATWTMLTNTLTWGAGSVGAVDGFWKFDSGGGDVTIAQWDESADALLIPEEARFGDEVRMDALLEFSAATSRIDFETAGQGIGLIGGIGTDLDLITVVTNQLTTGCGTVGDADIVWMYDSGGGGTALKTYDESDEQLEFNIPVQVPELDVVEAGDAISVGAWTRYLMISAGSAALGPTAPAFVSVETIGALAFDADAEVVFITKEIPDDWNGTSDLSLKTYWTNEPADAIADTETVKFDISYRSLLWDTEDVDNNAAVAGTVTYTQSGGGNDGETFEHSITLDYDHGDQPLTAGDVICIQFDRDVTGDTYGGDAYVVQWEIVYTSIGLPNHN